MESKKQMTRSEEKMKTVPQDGPHPEVMPNGVFVVETHDLETGREFKRVGLREQKSPNLTQYFGVSSRNRKMKIVNKLIQRFRFHLY